MLVCLAVEVLLVLGLRFYLVWENKRRALKLEASSDPAVGEGADGLHLLDQEDGQMLGYRYLY